MTTGRENQLTKQVGEYLVSAELCRQGFIATSFTGNVPEFDILAVNGNNETIPLQVKTIKQGTWQLNAGNYLDIEVKDEEKPKQIIKGKKQLTQNIIYVFVKLNGLGKDDFYIIKIKDLQDIIFNGYSKYLDKHDGRRPKNYKSFHTDISEVQLTGYKDRWDLI